MRINKEIYDYLRGIKFSNGKEFKNFFDPRYKTLLELIINLISNKKVIHIGACDHIELIEKKIKENRYLHKIITEVSEKCVGIDINKEAILYLRKNYKIDNIIYFDILENKSFPEEIMKYHFDYILALDVLEHIDNPIQFLKFLKKKLQSISGKIIISTPNAFCFQNIIGTFRNLEIINTDHRYWFTPYTLAKISNISGIRINNIFLVNRDKFVENFILKFIYSKFPLMRDTVVLEGEFENEEN